eukprot:NODE_2007_length_1307_cov_128.483051_g1910_i0.p1 GENE.NODE_2007_length_1307_cov_128.483051_g1910_i0~~NODE_2007_length_1307_cov_128.483051_g1910_i0.p1  ORF type:complete len:418 (+),score=125.19 NODE_2007_length_1307_cov_128.483051_g1910_i0:59-1255(+)
MRFALALLLSLYGVASEIYFQEKFDADWAKRWVPSSAKSDLGKFEHSAGKFYGDAEQDKGIQTSQDAKFYAISAKAEKTLNNKDQTLVIQFSIKHEQNIDCGGGYLKLLPSLDLSKFDGDSKYNIMFGPDICGHTKKVHFIFNYKGQNLLWKKEPACESDTLTHVYTAIIKPDNTYEMLIDNVKKESGKLEDDWDFLKPRTIPDPKEKKPADWVDEADMLDPEDTKPADWDAEPETVVDPEATQPEDWDEEEDGTWEAPTIPNPKFKGEWKQKRIPNPKYVGPWKAKEIPNPDFVADDQLYAFEDFSAVGIDIWQVKSGTVFDNIIVTNSVEEAKAFYDATTGLTKDGEKKMHDAQEAATRAKEEEERKAREAEDKATGGDEEDDEDEDDDEKSNDEL